MKFFFFLVLSLTCVANANAKSPTVVVSNITDTYTQDSNGHFILENTRYLVGSYADIKGQGQGIQTELKVVKYKKDKTANDDTKLKIVRSIAEQMSSREMKNAKIDISDTTCEVENKQRICTSSIEMVY